MVLARQRKYYGSSSLRPTPIAASGEDLVSQLDLYAVSLMERTGDYGSSGMGSTPVLRASKVVGCILISVNGN